MQKLILCKQSQSATKKQKRQKEDNFSNFTMFCEAPSNL